MTLSFLNETSTGQPQEVLAAFRLLFNNARRFYQHNAETSGSGNLRRQFATLAELHQQILYLLPGPNHRCTNPGSIEALSELSYWYDNKRNQISLPTVQQQLVRQLQLQKAMIRTVDLGRYREALLHFTASLQIATDQLAEIKTC